MAIKRTGSAAGCKGSSEIWRDDETGKWVVFGFAPYFGELRQVVFAQDDHVRDNRHDITSTISERGELPKGIENRIEDFMLGRCHKYSHTPLTELDNDMVRVGWQMTA